MLFGGGASSPAMCSSQLAMSRCYKRVCTDIIDDEWHTVSVRKDSSVGEVLKALKVQGVDVVGKTIAEGDDLYTAVSKMGSNNA